MKWKYHIPHAWDPATQRMGWAEVWLLPDDPGYNGGSIWLTIDALSGGPDDVEPAEFRREALQKLGDQDVWVKGSDMIVRVENFDRQEFLQWAKVWLEYTGLKVSELVEAPFEDFAGTNNMARVIKEIRKNYPE
jgi:hypothetical protein